MSKSALPEVVRLVMKSKKDDRAILLQIEERRLIEELPLRGGIFFPTEAVPVAERVAGLKRVRAIYEWWWKREYAPRLRELRRQYAGKERCFIIGNGPSLNRTDLTKLRDEVTFGVNGLFLKFEEMGFAPTFYVVEDHLVAEDRAQEINAIKGPLKLFPFNLAYCLDEGPDTLFFNHRPRPNPAGFEFSTDASRITYTGCTVTFTCMQLAFYLGFPEIYLVGVDASYEIPKAVERHDHYGVAVLDMQGDDPNHFHPDYFGKGYRWHDPQVNKMVAAYGEARRVTEARGVRIRNATIGGKLEVFERVDYESLFRPVDGAGMMSLFPRVLILDMTCLGSSSATGQIKKTLFTGWPEGRLAQVFAAGHGRFGLYRGGAVPAALGDLSVPAEAIDWCRSFDPDVVYFRPHDHPRYFHELALQAIDALGVPLVTHLMDDWPARAGAGGVFGSDRLTRRLPRLLERSAVRLSICEAMSSAFEARYGLRFQAIANGVEPAVWQALDGERAMRRAATEPLLIRYVGGLADDMGLRSLLDVAEVVDKLLGEIGVRLEIHTTRTWKAKADAVFGRSRGVSVHEAGISEEGYRRLLIGCHLLLIAYNFDARSIAYVRYSMANKMPECLASGVPVMAYGPMAIATVAYLVEHRVAEAVTTRDPALLETALRRFTGDPDYGRTLSDRGRAFAFERHPAKAVRERLHASLSEAASQHGFAPGVKPKSSDDAGLCGCHSRRARLTINEGALVAEVLSGTSGGDRDGRGGPRPRHARALLDGRFHGTHLGTGHHHPGRAGDQDGARGHGGTRVQAPGSPHGRQPPPRDLAKRPPARDPRGRAPAAVRDVRLRRAEWLSPARPDALVRRTGLSGLGQRVAPADTLRAKIYESGAAVAAARALPLPPRQPAGLWLLHRHERDRRRGGLRRGRTQGDRASLPDSIDPMAGPDGSALRAEGSARGDEGQALGQGPDQPDPGRDRGLSRRSSSRCLG